MSGYRHSGMTQEEYETIELFRKVVDIINGLPWEDSDEVFLAMIDRMTSDTRVSLYRAVTSCGYSELEFD